MFTGIAQPKVGMNPGTIMRDSKLLVRLKTSEHKINKLKELKLHAEAAKVEREQRIKNLEIIRAWRKGFKFCEVQFFFSNNSDKVKRKDYAGIFLNDTLGAINKLEMNCISIFTADVGDIYFKTYNSTMSGIGIMDDKFNLLDNKKYHVVRKREGLFLFKRSYLDMVHLLNKRLVKFYED